LKELAAYVQRTSKGDEVLISTSGFDMNKRREPVGPLAKPEKLNLVPGINSGTVELSCEAVQHARVYEFEYRELPSENGNGWVACVSTKRKVVIEGLAGGKQYVFRVAAVGANPARNWSDELVRYIM